MGLLARRVTGVAIRYRLGQPGAPPHLQAWRPALLDQSRGGLVHEPGDAAAVMGGDLGGVLSRIVFFVEHGADGFGLVVTAYDEHAVLGGQQRAGQ